MIKINNDVLLESNKEKYNISFEVSKDNKKIIKVEFNNKSIYLGSKYNVQRDLDKVINFVKNNIKENNIIIIGLGTGEYIDSIAELIEDERKILIIEPNEDIYKSFKSLNNKIYDSVEIIWYNSENIKKFESAIGEFALETFKLLYYPNYMKVYNKEIHHICNNIISISKNCKINSRTGIFFSRIWFDCFVKNIKYLGESESIENYKDIYLNKPAIIVSAGPSLSKNIQELHKFKNKALIFTGGRTLKTLMDENINPDFLCIVDSQELSYGLVKDVIDKVDTTLIHSELLPSKVFEKHKGKRLFYAMNPSIKSIIGNIEFDLRGSSVAHNCLNSALYMGCNPIIFVGQDLAYTDDKIHAENAEFRDESLTKYEDIKSINEKDIELVDDIYGNKVKTRADLKLFKKQFEEIIKDNPNKMFIDSTEGGAKIEGTVIKDLLDNVEVLNSSNIEKFNLYDNDKICINHIDILSNAEKKCNKAVIMLNDAIKHNEYYYNTFITKGKIKESSLKILDEVDDFLKNISEEMNFTEYLFADIINKTLHDSKYKINKDDTEIQKAKKIYDRGNHLYTEMKKQIEYALVILKEELK